MSATGEPAGRAAPVHERGFTLMEMLVVIGLLALVTGIGFPAMMGTYNGLAASVSRSAVAADLTAARALAERTGRPVSFAVTPDGRRYDWAGQARLLPRGVLMGQDRIITFSSDGTSNGGRIVLASRGRRQSLTVDAATGLVEREAAQ